VRPFVVSILRVITHSNGDGDGVARGRDFTRYRKHTDNGINNDSAGIAFL
jgi:hypothetical protein